MNFRLVVVGGGSFCGDDGNLGGNGGGILKLTLTYDDPLSWLVRDTYN